MGRLIDCGETSIFISEQLSLNKYAIKFLLGNTDYVFNCLMVLSFQCETDSCQNIDNLKVYSL